MGLSLFLLNSLKKAVEDARLKTYLCGSRKNRRLGIFTRSDFIKNSCRLVAMSLRCGCGGSRQFVVPAGACSKITSKR